MKIFRKFIRLIIISLTIFSLLETSLFSSVTLVQAVGERCGGAWDWECAKCPDGSSRKKGCQHTVAEDGSCSGPESCDDCPACGEPPAPKPSCNRREYNECIPGQPGFSRHVIQKEDCNYEVTVESQRDSACGVPPESPPPPPQRCPDGRSVGETFTMCEKIGKSRQWKMNEQCQEKETGVIVDDPSCKLGQMPPPQEPKKDSLPPQQRQRERAQQVGISDCYSRPINRPYLEGGQCFQCDDVSSQPSAIELSQCTTPSPPPKLVCKDNKLYQVIENLPPEDWPATDCPFGCNPEGTDCQPQKIGIYCKLPDGKEVPPGPAWATVQEDWGEKCKYTKIEKRYNCGAGGLLGGPYEERRTDKQHRANCSYRKCESYTVYEVKGFGFDQAVEFCKYGCLNEEECKPPPQPKPSPPLVKKGPEPVPMPDSKSRKEEVVAQSKTDKNGQAEITIPVVTREGEFYRITISSPKHTGATIQKLQASPVPPRATVEPTKIPVPVVPRPTPPRSLFPSLVKTAFAAQEQESQKVIISLFEDKNRNGIQDPEESTLKEEGAQVMIEKIAQQGEAYPLLEGWNLISLAVVPSVANTASKLLAEIARQGGYVTTVSRFENGQWEEYIQRGSQKFGHDFPLEPGRGYFLRNHQKVTFILQGQPITQNLPLNLKNGWNVIGIPSPTQELIGGKLLDGINQIDKTLPENATLVSRWESGLWDTFVKRIYTPENIQEYGNNFPIEKTRGYAVKIERGVKFTP